MEWVTSLKESVNFIENNLLDIESPDEVASHVGMSTVYLQQGFRILTGVTIGEYIRNRRLTLAALELLCSDARVIDIALKYGYDTPTSFNKAFQRFHDANPSEVRHHEKAAKSFDPIRISVSVKGGVGSGVEIVEREAVKVIGFTDIYTMEKSGEIAERWRRINTEYAPLFEGRRSPSNDIERTVLKSGLGCCGVSEYAGEDGSFRYVFAGRYDGGEVPDGMIVYEIPKGLWAVFSLVGKLPESWESLNNRIWNEWVPNNGKYEVSGKCEFEWYAESEGSSEKVRTWIDPYTDPAFLCTKWIPIRPV